MQQAVRLISIALQTIISSGYFRRISFLLTILLLPLSSQAQLPSFASLSSIRHKTIAVNGDTLRLDSLTIAPSSLTINHIEDSLYVLYPYQSLLVWKHKPHLDSVTVRYRVLPLSFTKRYAHKSPNKVDSNTLFYLYRSDDYYQNSLFKKDKLDYQGSYGRTLTVGNQQDVVLNSQFNLQANGYILDSIKLEAALTDNTLPFQPEGNTQRLQEFDQIVIRLSKNQHLLQMGDYQLDAPPSYFLNYYKRVQGLYYQTAFPLNKNTKNKVGISGSIAKGQFARNSFQGKEGNQGPYKLTGNNGELFFIVLAGTEKVFIDNILLTRGEKEDYTINYNTAEIIFMPRKMITKDSRIQVEFEYQDRNYLNSLFYAYDELQLNKKWCLRLDAYSNQDAKNQPYLQTLDGNQKRFLSQLGDSISKAFYPSVARDTFAANKILYRMVDTFVNGVLYDSVFVYATHPDTALYALSFSFVGPNKGNYNMAASVANGRSYEWSPPINGIAQGSYMPAQYIITPKKQQVFILQTHYQIDSFKSLHIELGASNNDPNLFATKDNSSHWGWAAKVNYQEQRTFYKQPSLPVTAWKWTNEINYEWVQSQFKTIAPYRSREFGRDWNTPIIADQKPDEHLASLTTQLQQVNFGKLRYELTTFHRGQWYQGFRNLLQYTYQKGNLRAGITGNLLSSKDTFQSAQYLRPSAFAEYRLSLLKQSFFGGSYEVEHNALKKTNTDSLLPTAFYFDVAKVYWRSDDRQSTKWNLSYYTRADRIIRNNTFQNHNRSQNIELKLGLSHWKNHQLNLMSSFRQLQVADTTVTNLRPEQSLLGRLDYNGNWLKNVFQLNSLYEFGSGQEQRRAYTYIEVPAGQGVYTWIDYNGDGMQQTNEFETALYPDQKRFIKILTPTNDYVKVNYVHFNLSLNIEPANYYWEASKRSNFQSFLARFSSQSSLQINHRILANEGLKAYNPFASSLTDTAIISTNTAISTFLYFNRAHTKWGFDYNLITNTGKQLLLYGIEGNQQQQHLYKLRWNLAKPIALYLQTRHGQRSYHSALTDNRSYELHYLAVEPSLTWLYKGIFRLTTTFKYEDRNNHPRLGGEAANIQTAQLEARFSQPSLGALLLRGSYAAIHFTGTPGTSVAFTMLDALQKGNNYLWQINWERQVGKGIEVLLEYEGRKPGQGSTFHTGRMTIRAIL